MIEAFVVVQEIHFNPTFCKVTYGKVVSTNKFGEYDDPWLAFHKTKHIESYNWVNNTKTTVELKRKPLI